MATPKKNEDTGMPSDVEMKKIKEQEAKATAEFKKALKEQGDKNIR